MAGQKRGSRMRPEVNLIEGLIMSVPFGGSAPEIGRRRRHFSHSISNNIIIPAKKREKMENGFALYVLFLAVGERNFLLLFLPSKKRIKCHLFIWTHT